MQIQKNIIIPGWNGMPITLDIFYSRETKPAPVVVYAHGFNGFKDWGNFDLIATQIAAAGFTFIKFNFSHNGTSPEQPETFVDLEAFGKNNYSIELAELKMIIDWTVSERNPFGSWIDSSQVALLGHSMGAGISILHAARDKRITKLVTWASIATCKTPWGSWPAEKMEHWKETGVEHYHNSRTGQDMPLCYQLYEDYALHSVELDIVKAMASLSIPVLLCHGVNDPAVPVAEAYRLQEALPGALLFLVESDHVFGRRHPAISDQLPEPMQVVLTKTISFLQEDMH